MAEKKIIDVTSADKVAPSSSGRPIIVTNRPVLSGDPMVVSTASADKPAATEPVARTAKTIKPVSKDMKPAAEEKVDNPEATPPVETPEKAPETEPKSEPETETETETPEPTSEESAQDAPADPPSQRDNEAAATAAEAAEAAARQAREAELEQLISSGKYAVPVNSADRKRTEHTSIALTIFVVLLALLLVDLMLDANIIELIQKLPHTHFFTAK